MRAVLAALVAMTLAGCAGPVVLGPVSTGPAGAGGGQPSGAALSEAQLRDRVRTFARVTADLEPVIERECRDRAPRRNCDFQLVVDDRPGQPPNAFQTVDAAGRPVVGFTPALIVMAENADELAFVMAHEAAHHIRGHLGRQTQNAALGAAVLGGLAGAAGASTETLRAAQQLGASVGARSYSKAYELEADALGAVIAQRAGYDPLRGARFFNRVPDPGDRFLGTHPPNAQRLATVQRAVAGP